MKRTVYYIQGRTKLHRSIKCAENTNTYGDSILMKINIPENEYAPSDYCRTQVPFAHVCLRCWHCMEDKET